MKRRILASKMKRKLSEKGPAVFSAYRVKKVSCPVRSFRHKFFIRSDYNIIPVDQEKT